MPVPDKSNGYEEIAHIYIAGRGQNASGIGASVVAEWSQMLPDGANVLDLGCGTGVPITKTLIERGLHVYGIDASPSMLAAFRARFPAITASALARNYQGLLAKSDPPEMTETPVLPCAKGCAWGFHPSGMLITLAG